MLRTASLACLVLFAAGCATIPAEEKALLTQDIDCARAEETIEAIRDVRPTEIDRARVLASSLTLGGLAYGAATGDLADRERLMSGEYDEQLGARIREIALECGLAVPELGRAAAGPASGAGTPTTAR